MASNFTTWRGVRTRDSSESDPLEDALGDLVRAAQRDLDGASRIEGPNSKDGGELVERPDSVSFVLMAAGYSLGDFEARVEKDELVVCAPDFEIRRRIGCQVEPSQVRTDYRNGVLSVRVAKRL